MQHYLPDGMKDKNLFLIFGWLNNGFGLPKVGYHRDGTSSLLLTCQCVAGNSMWEKPTDLLFHLLKVKPELTFLEFMRLLDFLFRNMHVLSSESQLHALATKFWMGETIWRRFVKDLLTIHIRGPIVPRKWETIGDE